MILKKYYSTLLNQNFDSKKVAEAAEDSYVKNYFKELNRKAEVKRRMKKIITKI